MKQTIALSIVLSVIFMFSTPMYGQRRVAPQKPAATQSKGNPDLQQVQKILRKQLKGYTNVRLFNKYGHKEINLPAGLVERYVIEYYHLLDKYNSPLKRKMFKQSSEYETLLGKMETERHYCLLIYVNRI